jgi:hypothetical protein
MKSVYSSSADLKALNGELGAGPGNCRVQVLPVCWRHLLDFPRQRERKGEEDIGVGPLQEEEYPSLEDITIEGVAFARSLVSDLALDVLLYQSGYCEQIMAIVLQEANRILNLFKRRNPEFKGKVHLVGHSLGSAILFDLLCLQKDKPQSSAGKTPFRFWPGQPAPEPASHADQWAFNSDIEDFYCLGSPVGLFQMLEGRKISARDFPSSKASQRPLDLHSYGVTGLPDSTSSPKVRQLYNIFHPSDPISYRIEPLVSPSMAALKPQALPYTKKGIFGNVAPQGLSGIGVKVGQSVSGLWSSLSAGIASSLLNRSLGLSNEEVARMNVAETSSMPPQPQGAGTNISAGGVIPDARGLGERTNERKKELADASAASGANNLGEHGATLIDDDLETLYSRFQKTRGNLEASGAAGEATAEQREDDQQAQKMRTEDARVRALNRNGRIDYSIQE